MAVLLILSARLTGDSEPPKDAGCVERVDLRAPSRDLGRRSMGNKREGSKLVHGTTCMLFTYLFPSRIARVPVEHSV